MNGSEMLELAATLKNLRAYMYGSGDVDGRLFRAWLRIKEASELVESCLREQGTERRLND